MDYSSFAFISFVNITIQVNDYSLQHFYVNILSTI
jgi:hypothetical protein